MALSLDKAVKQRIMKLFSILAISLFVSSCGTTKNSTQTEEIEMTSSKPERNYQMKSSIGEFAASEPFTIEAVRNEGNLLFVDISFVGGCGVHNFKCTGSNSIMKSLPPKRSVQISHDVPRETCENNVKKTLEIDISELAASRTPGSTIMLLLDGWDEEIKYVFE